MIKKEDQKKDPKELLEIKKKAEHDREMKAELLQKKQYDDLLSKQEKQRNMDEKIRQATEKRRDGEAKKRLLRTKELEFRIFSAETDRLKNLLKADMHATGANVGAAMYKVQSMEHDIDRTISTKKYRIEFLMKEISRLQVEMDGRKQECERLKQEIQIAERQKGHETNRVLTHADGRLAPDEAKIHREKMQIGEKEFKLQQMHQEIISLKSDIKKDDEDLRALENELRVLR